MMKRNIQILAALLLLFLSSCANDPQDNKAKYVFYFIGDGMGFSHIALTEAYIAEAVTPGEADEPSSFPLCFTQFPVMGMATTYSASNWITCSSAAGTALSTGFKTGNHMLGVLPDSTELTSISYMIHNAGRNVGIMSNVPIDHATPACFYASSASRSDYFNVASQMPASGFEFFAGGGLYGVKGVDAQDSTKRLELEKMIADAGYSIAYGMDDYKSKKDNHGKMVLVQSGTLRGATLPYASDREITDMSLTDMVETAIERLDDGKGFFIMAEGGMIDWAAHDNDVANTIYEIIDMDQAIRVAYDFYLEHPDETLIVVTADHETGGVSIGRGSGYSIELENVPAMKSDTTKSNLTLDNYMHGPEQLDSVSVKTKIGWTTSSHCGGAVPVFAIGAGSLQFAGRQNNTDIPRKICSAMGIEFNPDMKKQ